MRASQSLNLDAYPELLTANDLATILRVHRVTLSKMHTAGQLPAPRLLGSQQRWAKEEIVAWWEADCPNRQEWEARRKVGGRR